MLSYENNFKSQRKDGRFTSHLAAHMEMLRHHKPLLRLPDELTPESFAKWQGEVKEKVKELLSLPEITPQPAPKRLSCVQRKGYRVEKWELYPDDYMAIPFLMLIPDNVNEENKAPAVFCLPGAITSKEWLAGEPLVEGKPSFTKYPERNHMAKHYVENGMIAFAFDHPEQCECQTGELRGRSSGQLNFGYLQFGLTYIGMQAFPILLALEFAKTLGFVDASRLAVSAHSLGTVPVAMLALLSDDIGAVVFNDFVCDTQSRYVTITEMDETAVNALATEWHMLPGLWKWLSYPDMLAALAPKYLACNEGGATMHLDTIRRAYDLLGMSDRLRITQYPKYQEPASRHHEGELPKYGMSLEAYYAACYVDAPDHSFRAEPSLALLKDAFHLK